MQHGQLLLTTSGKWMQVECVNLPEKNYSMTLWVINESWTIHHPKHRWPAIWKPSCRSPSQGKDSHPRSVVLLSEKTSKPSIGIPFLGSTNVNSLSSQVPPPLFSSPSVCRWAQVPKRPVAPPPFRPSRPEWVGWTLTSLLAQRLWPARARSLDFLQRKIWQTISTIWKPKPGFLCDFLPARCFVSNQWCFAKKWWGIWAHMALWWLRNLRMLPA